MTLVDGDTTVTIVRSASDDRPATAVTPDVTVLGQGEIEAVGAQASMWSTASDRQAQT